MHGIRCLSGRMEPTRTFSARWWKWIASPGLSCDGIAILGQTVERTGEVQEDAYGVAETPCAFPGGREFVVRKLGAAIGSDDEQYRTTISPRQSWCTCTAGRCRTDVCKHRCGLSAIILAGALPAVQSLGA